MKIVEINDKLKGKTINVVVETEKSHNIQNVSILDIMTSKTPKCLCIKTGKDTSIELPRRTIENLAMDGCYEDVFITCHEGSFKKGRIIYKVL